MIKPLLASCLLSCALLGTAYAQDPIVTINGKALSEADFNAYITLRNQHVQQKQTDRKVLLDEFVRRELIIQDATAKKIAEQSDFIAQVDNYRTNLMVETAITQYVESHKVTDEDLKKEYDTVLASIQTPKEYQVRHILVEKEEDAKALIAELDKGADFSVLARDKSKDTASAQQQGKLGWIRTKSVVPEFAKAMETQKKGEYSKEPVKSQFGFHIVLVDDTRDVAPPSFERVKEKIRENLHTRLIQAYMDELKNKATIDVPVEVITEEVAVEKAEKAAEPAEKAAEPAAAEKAEKAAEPVAEAKATKE